MGLGPKSCGLGSLVLAAGLLTAPPAAAGTWEWPTTFTEASSPDLAALHEALASPAPSLQGVEVRDLRWRAEAIEVHLQEGHLYPEPAIEGAQVGVYFQGRGTFTFRPGARKSRDDLKDYLGSESLESEEITHAYFFSLRDTPVLQQLGVTVQPAVPLLDDRSYAHAKQAFRMSGTRLLNWFLNREGRARNTELVLLAPSRLREEGSEDVYLVYRFDPTVAEEIRLQTFGHTAMGRGSPGRYQYRDLVAEDAGKWSGMQGDVKLFHVELSLNHGLYETRQKTAIHFEPGPGLRAARITYVPWMVVEAVTGCEGESLPFVQWAEDKKDPDWDTNLVVDLKRTPPPEAVCVLTVVAQGSLKGEEDDWFPRFLGYRPTGKFELLADVPKNTMAIAPGVLVSERVENGRRHFHYRTTKEQTGATLKWGQYSPKEAQVGKIQVVVYAKRDDINDFQNQEFVLDEVGNMLRVYSELLVPLEIPALRVVSTHARHGRGFEGLLLLGRGGFEGYLSGQDTFRAHEVAHQWWGNTVTPNRFRQDRWLSEAFAEYMAMEYYRIRFDSVEKWRKHLYESWHVPMVDATRISYENLAGEKVRMDRKEHFPLVDGLDNVYTKGPAVLHMLRYYFLVEKGSDKVFWEMLQKFLTRYKYKSVRTPKFAEHAEEHLGQPLDWFFKQWYEGRRLPTVTWSYELQERPDGWLLDVVAEQNEDYRLLIPVTAHFGKGRQVSRPLVLDGPSGSKKLLLPEQPRDVTLNDNHEALVLLRRKP